MFSWFQVHMPKEARFFDMFERRAETLVAGSRALRALLDGGPEVPAFCQEIKRREHEADEISRDALLAIRRTFITPFDRSDIHDLITATDGAIDRMHRTAKAAILYETRAFEPAMHRMADMVVQAVELTKSPSAVARHKKHHQTRRIERGHFAH